MGGKGTKGPNKGKDIRDTLTQLSKSTDNDDEKFDLQVALYHCSLALHIYRCQISCPAKEDILTSYYQLIASPPQTFELPELPNSSPCDFPPNPIPVDSLDFTTSLRTIQRQIREAEEAISKAKRTISQYSPPPPRATPPARSKQVTVPVLPVGYAARPKSKPLFELMPTTRQQPPAFAGLYFAYPEDPEMELPWLTPVLKRVNAKWWHKGTTTTLPRLIFFVVLVYDRVSHFLDSQTEDYFNLTGKNVLFSYSSLPIDFDDRHIRSTLHGQHVTAQGTFAVALSNTGQQAKPVFSLSEPEALAVQIESVVRRL